MLGDTSDLGSAFRLHPRAIEQRVAELGDRYGMAVDPRARIWQLSVGEQQRVEILKALYREARILILDEPTAVLTPQEAEALFETMRAMAADGRTVIFISHKLHEVMAVSDRVTVLRDGQAVATVATAGSTLQSLASLMVGRELHTFERHDEEQGDRRGAARGRRADGRGRPRRRRCQRRLLRDSRRRDPRCRRRGRQRAARARRGGHGAAPADGRGDPRRGAPLAPATRGPRSRRVSRTSPRTGCTPASRRASASPRTSCSSRIARARTRPGRSSASGSIRDWAVELIRRYDVKAPGPGAPARQLSGGNLQKVVLAREFAGGPRVLVIARADARARRRRDRDRARAPARSRRGGRRDPAHLRGPRRADDARRTGSR